jgi:preprotein translocase subunit SecD
MKPLLAIALLALLAAPASAKRPLAEFHVLEDSPGAGLQSVDVPAMKAVKYMHPEVVLLGNDIAAVAAMRLPQGERALQITFTHDGAAKLARVTAASVGKCLAVVIDGKVVVAPRIMSAITAGVAQIVIPPEQSLEKIAAALQPLPPH